MFASLLQPHRLRVGSNRPPSERPVHDEAVNGGRVQGHRQLPAAQAAGVRDAVKHAFLDGMQIGSLVCAAIALAAAVIVAALLPAREGRRRLRCRSRRNQRR